MTSSYVTSFGGYKNPKKIKRLLDSTTTYEKYLLFPFSVWAILVWEYWNPPKICNKKVTTRLWYAAGPYWHTFGGIGPRAKALGPILPKVCQYGPLAYHSRVITYKYWKKSNFRLNNTLFKQRFGHRPSSGNDKMLWWHHDVTT